MWGVFPIEKMADEASLGTEQKGGATEAENRTNQECPFGLAPNGRYKDRDDRSNGSDGAADAELAHAGLKRGALHAEKDGGAARAGDAPLGLAEGAEDVLALGFFESGDGRRGGRGS